MLVSPDINAQLTKSDRRILEFIETNKEEFLIMTIVDLAHKLDLSEATISRFARKIGTKDFKDLRNQVFDNNTNPGAAGKMRKTLDKNKDADLDNYLQKQIDNINKTLSHLDKEQFDQACIEISKRKKIYVFAKHAGKALANLLKVRLGRIGIEVVTLASGGTEMIEGLAQINPEDLILVFSFTKISKEAAIILEQKAEAKYKVILFTSRIYQAEEEDGDLNIYVYRGEKNEYHSQTAPTAILDAMIVKITKLTKDHSLENLEKIKKLKSKYQD